MPVATLCTSTRIWYGTEARTLNFRLNHDIKQQVKPTNDTEGKKKKLKDLDPKHIGNVLARKTEERAQGIFSHPYKYLLRTHSKKPPNKMRSRQHFPVRFNLKHREYR